MRDFTWKTAAALVCTGVAFFLAGTAQAAERRIGVNVLPVLADPVDGARPVGIFNSKLQRETLLMSRMESIQEDALARREFHVWYQPKYELKTKRCIGAEALVRWESKELGFLPPGKFIPLFEGNGFISQLDFYNLEHVMQFQREAPGKGLPVLPISVNQSRQHMREEDYIERVRKLVAEYGTTGVELELTETAFDVLGEAMRAHSIDVVESLRGMGFSIDMDDFGSGYSDLALLNQLPLDVRRSTARCCSPRRAPVACASSSSR
ncbi:EAL domain-containing protein [Selenomonas sp.]|uniref:EAL domain-containing protein n=1 Tax=Selenomonas sp. TaxID=2053611 RepID=UPI002A760D6F|nr:EAL domain-containing protein [Selenomonas sp.]MDY3298769.1 EAL domain-containing protein [Selenomonas sp.]